MAAVRGTLIKMKDLWTKKTSPSFVQKANKGPLASFVLLDLDLLTWFTSQFFLLCLCHLCFGFFLRVLIKHIREDPSNQILGTADNYMLCVSDSLRTNILDGKEAEWEVSYRER